MRAIDIYRAYCYSVGTRLHARCLCALVCFMHHNSKVSYCIYSLLWSMCLKAPNWLVWCASQHNQWFIQVRPPIKLPYWCERIVPRPVSGQTVMLGVHGNQAPRAYRENSARQRRVSIHPYHPRRFYQPSSEFTSLGHWQESGSTPCTVWTHFCCSVA